MTAPTNFKSTAGFDAANQKVVNLADAVAPTDAMNLRTFDAKSTIPVYLTNRAYPVDFIVEFAGQLWKCVSATAAGAFDKTKWTAIRGTENWIRITGTYTATNMDSLLVDTTSNAITITLPASPKTGDYINIVDAGSADINAITINRNGATIGGSASNSVITEPGLQMTLVYLNGTWQTNIRTKNRVGLVNTTATLLAGIEYAVQANASFTVTLPAAPKAGDWVVLMDRSGTVGSYPITVAGNSKQIDGAASFTMNQKRSAYQFTYSGTAWFSFMLAGNDLQANKNLSDVEDKAAARSNLGLGTLATMNQGTAAAEIRTNAQNDLVYQGFDQTLKAFGELVFAANKLAYGTGPDTFDTTDLTAQARDFLAQATTASQRASMGLGTAATYSVGTAIGQLLATGAFGLGSVAPTNNNPDATTVTGFHSVPSTAANAPSATSATMLHIEKSDGASQFAIDTNSVIYIRSRNAAVWGVWAQIAATSSFGTAAFKNIGTSLGQVLEVGAFGLGYAATTITTTNYDLNSATNTGFYTLTGGANLNGPITGQQNLLVFGSVVAGVPKSFQISQPIGTEDYYIRSQSAASTWSTWKRLYHSGNTGWVPVLPSTSNGVVYAVKNGAWVAITQGTVSDIENGVATTYPSNAAVRDYVTNAVTAVTPPYPVKFPTAGRGDIIASNMHMIMSDGSVTSWGAGDIASALGIGETVTTHCWDAVKPIFNVMPPDGVTVKSISRAGCCSFMVMTNGWVYSCGANDYGQLGHGDTTDRNIWTRIEAFLTGVNYLVDKVVVAGTYRYSPTMASVYFLMTDGRIYSCGYNAYGQLGQGDTANKSVPGQVYTGSVAVRDIIVSGESTTHVGYINTNDQLYMWGYNGTGQVGDGTTVNKTSPVLIDSNVQKVVMTSGWSSGNTAAGGTTLILYKDNTLKACGLNSSGQVGDSTTGNKSTPTTVAMGGFSGVMADIGCAGGYYSTFWMTTTAGVIYTWGYSADYANGSGTAAKTAPTSVTTFNDVDGNSLTGTAPWVGKSPTIISVPNTYTPKQMFILDSDGRMWMSGLDDGYFTGNTASVTRQAFTLIRPPRLLPGEKFVDVYQMGGHTNNTRLFALTNKFNLYARGYDYGSLTRATGTINTTSSFMKNWQKLVLNK